MAMIERVEQARVKYFQETLEEPTEVYVPSKHFQQVMLEIYGPQEEPEQILMPARAIIGMNIVEIEGDGEIFCGSKYPPEGVDSLALVRMI
jgi:hypothetical protein